MPNGILRIKCVLGAEQKFAHSTHFCTLEISLA